jgi:hypothetical protein
MRSTSRGEVAGSTGGGVQPIVNWATRSQSGRFNRKNAAPVNTVDANWKQNGPNYILSDRDGAMIGRATTINSFTDGTSTNASFSERGKGPAALPAKNRLGMVHNLGLPIAGVPSDLQFSQAARGTPILSAAGKNQHQPSGSQNWGWKGKLWAFGGTVADSHTNLRNRYALDDSDNAEDGRAGSTMIKPSSNQPRGVNVLFMDGGVRFIKSSVIYQPWIAIATPDLGETVSQHQLSD